MTLEGFRDAIRRLEHFNRTANRVSSGIMDEGKSQPTKTIWEDDEVQSVLEAGLARKSLDTIFNKLAGELGNCEIPHAAMIHLTGLNSIKLMLASCSNPPVWRQTICSAILDQE